MVAFFTKANRRARATMNYAQALQEARKAVRKNKRWSSPFYWAPFVAHRAGGLTELTGGARLEPGRQHKRDADRAQVELNQA